MEATGRWLATLLVALLHVAGTQSAVADVGIIDHETRLLANLTDPAVYNVNVRPAVSQSENVSVFFMLRVKTIMEVNEKAGYIAGSYWMYQKWQDPRLTWNPEDFGDLDEIYTTVDSIWTPDFQLYNSIRENSEPLVHTNRVEINYNGSVKWFPPTVLKSTCNLDLRRFPYDSHECKLMVGSWVYDGGQVDINLPDRPWSIRRADYNKDWIIRAVSVERKERVYSCCPNPFVYVTYTLGLQRRSGMYVNVYLVPGVMTSALVPLVFALPVGHSHRYILGGFLLVAATQLLTSFDQTFPTSHDGAPILGQYLTAVQVLVGISLGLSVLFTSLATKNPKDFPPPALMQTVFIGGLGRLLCLPRDKGRLHNEAEDPQDGDPPVLQNSDWLTMARVFDRLLLIVYLAVVIVMGIVFVAI